MTFDNLCDLDNVHDKMSDLDIVPDHLYEVDKILDYLFVWLREAFKIKKKNVDFFHTGGGVNPKSTLF